MQVMRREGLVGVFIGSAIANHGLVQEATCCAKRQHLRAWAAAGIADYGADCRWQYCAVDRAAVVFGKCR